MRNFLQNIGEFILDRPLQFVGILILLYIGWKQFVFWFRFARANYMGKNLVYMKVLMPRSDTQKDREKDTEKDFREKVGIMSQFYRNIHEISELNIPSWMVIAIISREFIITGLRSLAATKNIIISQPE